MSTFGEQLEPPGRDADEEAGSIEPPQSPAEEVAGTRPRALGRQRPGGADQLDCHSGYGRLGIDLSHEFPKPLTDEVVQAADAVITMGCGDACPIYPGKRYEGLGGPLPGREEP